MRDGPHTYARHNLLEVRQCMVIRGSMAAQQNSNELGLPHLLGGQILHVVQKFFPAAKGFALPIVPVLGKHQQGIEGWS